MIANPFIDRLSDEKPYPFIQVRITGRELDATLKTDMTRLYSQQETIVEVYSSKTVQASMQLKKINHETTSIFAEIDENCPVVFYFEKDNKKIKLPEFMTKNLVGFFKQYKPKNKRHYCCINFIYELLYGRDLIFHDNKLDNLEKREFHEEKLTPGNAIYLYKYNLFNDQTTYRHFAIYIGCGSYLSLFGDKGSLVVTTLNEMKNAWDANTCIEVTKLTSDKQLRKINESRLEQDRTPIKLGFVAAIVGLFYKNKYNNTHNNHTPQFTH